MLSLIQLIIKIQSNAKSNTTYYNKITFFKNSSTNQHCHLLTKNPIAFLKFGVMFLALQNI